MMHIFNAIILQLKNVFIALFLLDAFTHVHLSLLGDKLHSGTMSAALTVLVATWSPAIYTQS